MFGSGMRRVFAKQYADARARSQIRTSLLASPAPREPRAREPSRRSKTGKRRPRSMLGTWRIRQTELWDREALDHVEPAFVRFEPGHLGELAMIAVRADVDFRVEDSPPRVEFSFVGDDDGSPCSGRGWAALGEDDVLRGRLYIHRGDDSAFEAERVATPALSSRRQRRRGRT